MIELEYETGNLELRKKRQYFRKPKPELTNITYVTHNIQGGWGVGVDKLLKSLNLLKPITL